MGETRLVDQSAGYSWRAPRRAARVYRRPPDANRGRDVESSCRARCRVATSIASSAASARPSVATSAVYRCIHPSRLDRKATRCYPVENGDRRRRPALAHHESCAARRSLRLRYPDRESRTRDTFFGGPGRPIKNCHLGHVGALRGSRARPCGPDDRRGQSPGQRIFSSGTGGEAGRPHRIDGLEVRTARGRRSWVSPTFVRAGMSSV